MKIDLNTIRAAKGGESESMADLSVVANKRVFTYIYRLTMDYHLSQDLAQETVLDLIKFLPNMEFNHINPFWSWLYRTALGKVQHHYRMQGDNRIHQKTTADSDKLKQCLASFESGINTLMREELRKAVVDSMKNLKLRYRNILTLRCFDNLSYSDIAAISGGSELQARLLFFRAKQSLKHQLARKGVKKDQFFSAVGLFGILTATVTDNAAAATSISTASMKVTSTVTIFGMTVPKPAVNAVVGIVSLSIITGVGIKEYNRYKSPVSKPMVYTYLNPEPHPFSDLFYLLKSSEFINPSEVTDFNDPDNDGFRLVNSSSQERKPFISTPQSALVEDDSGDICIAMPRNHWVEVSFGGPIIDGPGPDLFYAGWNCRSMRIALIGEQGQSFILPILNCLPDCPARCMCYQIAPFDIAEYDLNFTPVKVRLTGLYDTRSFSGFLLSMVRARIAQQDQQ
ncbi:MAG: sigma-70 family RNA polymerase sigma factor [Sedimentisphaerales bacterium]|nr:sigma-70 family RNA polymerase sigma factor [Sedimentisphaerales bacterium]